MQVEKSVRQRDEHRQSNSTCNGSAIEEQLGGEKKSRDDEGIKGHQSRCLRNLGKVEVTSAPIHT